VSTDEIGLARLREGLELVRIGAPQRPEMAAWRYGDQFGRRRRRAILLGGAAVAAVGGYVIAGPVMGLLGGGSISLINIWNVTRSLYRSRSVAARVPRREGASLVVSREQLDQAALVWEAFDRRWSLDVSHRPVYLREPEWWERGSARQSTMLRGDDAVRAARVLLPSVNSSGARRGTVRDAVRVLEERPVPEALFEYAARTFAQRGRVGLKTVPTSVRLALEMSANEETERRALEGELHLLEAAWRDAEEIAGIADDMFLPASVDEELKRLKDRSRDSE
jgi:hypothetical protein